VIRRLKTITPAYVELQRELHARPNGYGGKGAKWTRAVLAVKAQYGASSVLDYGCGRGTLAEALQLATGHACREYDPAIPAKAEFPTFADLVVCTDVLEHVEPECLPATLEQLKALARKAIFVVVCLRPSNKTLSDGRNAHLIVQPAARWQAQCEAAGLTVCAPPPIHPVIVDDDKVWIAVLEPPREA
jgi:hypothetical protein